MLYRCISATGSIVRFVCSPASKAAVIHITTDFFMDLLLNNNTSPLNLRKDLTDEAEPASSWCSSNCYSTVWVIRACRALKVVWLSKSGGGCWEPWTKRLVTKACKLKLKDAICISDLIIHYIAANWKKYISRVDSFLCVERRLISLLLGFSSRYFASSKNIYILLKFLNQISFDKTQFFVQGFSQTLNAPYSWYYLK